VFYFDKVTTSEKVNSFLLIEALKRGFNPHKDGHPFQGGHSLKVRAEKTISRYNQKNENATPAMKAISRPIEYLNMFIIYLQE
jgi:hypothetical protein